METRSKSRGGQLQASSRNVLEDPVARSSTDPEEDLGISTLLDDGAGAAVGGSRPEVGAATRHPGIAPVGPDGSPLEQPTERTRAPVRKPVTETASRLSPIRRCRYGLSGNSDT